MAGLNYGTKYMYTKEYNRRKDQTKPGVYFSNKSNKYMVMLKNETNSKSIRPLINAAQFKTHEEAIKFYESKLSNDSTN